MTSDDLIAFYKKRKEDFEDRLTQIRKQIILVSNLRIIVALFFLLTLYFGLSYHLLLIAAFALLIVFAYLMSRHNTLFEQKVHLENLVRINHNELQALSGNLSAFYAGAEFVDPHHPYAHDLDIFGDASLFQSINRCNTFQGRAYMAQRLGYALESHSKILQNQEAVRELTSKIDFRQHFQAAGMEVNEQSQDQAQLIAWTKQPAFLFGKSFYRILLVLLPIATLFSAIVSFFVSEAKPIAILFVLAQWIMLGVHSKKVNEFHEYINRKKYLLEKYARLLHYIGKENFNSELLRSLANKAHDADVKVTSLATLVGYLNARLNFLTNVIVNSLLLYDLQCIYRLEKWKHENASNLSVWFGVISETEVLSSLGTFAFNHPVFIYPQINGELALTAVALGHPLLAVKECVTNDVYLGKDQSVLIITGANMAGKSTFLRTVGVNLVLAIAGAPVFAQKFSCPIVYLRTGMRTADSLKDHQSYFYAELDRLKSIMDELRSDKPLLVLLDEILKGTNSTDKQSGSIALIKQLIPHPCLAMIATHDIILGELETQFSGIKNFYFEANIENDQLFFDYKLKRGVAQKMNATFLMRKMGII